MPEERIKQNRRTRCGLNLKRHLTHETLIVGWDVFAKQPLAARDDPGSTICVIDIVNIKEAVNPRDKRVVIDIQCHVIEIAMPFPWIRTKPASRWNNDPLEQI